MSTASRFHFAGFLLDPLNEQLWRDHELIHLKAKPFALLRYLVDNPGRLVTHEELRRAIWAETHVSHGVLREHLREVRMALSDNAVTPQFIETVPRRGYRFLAQVTQDLSSLPIRPTTSTQVEPAAASIVGRKMELSHLHASLQTARAGRRQIVFINGEAGIGKSALLDAFVEDASTDDSVLIGRGQCIDQQGEGEPYMPMLEALQELCRAKGGREVTEILRRQAPTWLVQLPGLMERDAYDQLQQRVGGTGRSRMLREIAEALRQIGAHRLLVLALEDLQWSDPSTLTLIGLLARQMEGARLMIVATHRPAAALSAVHPLQALLRELTGRSCDLVALDALSVEEVEEYLSRRIQASGGDSLLMRQVARSIYQRTEGNPLFMTAVVESLLKSENEQRNDWASLHQRLDQVEHIAPKNLVQAIDQQFSLFSSAEQQLLESASVAGVAFSAAAVAAAGDLQLAAAEDRCAALARRMSFLQRTGEVEWPNGTVATGFRFRHQLFWESVYQRITVARRAILHQRVGEHEESAYGKRSQEISAELAHHFEQAHDFPRTLKYREQAARMALHRCASREALNHLSAGLGMLQYLGSETERIEYELRFRLLQGIALQTASGYGSSEVKQTYERASELCRAVGEQPQLFTALMGIWAYTAGRGEWPRARELAQRSLPLAESIGEPSLLARSWRAKGQVSLFSGEFERAREELERAVNLAPQTKPPLDPNTAVDARCAFAWTLEILGLSDQALAVMRKALSLAEQCQNSFDISYATFFGTSFYSMRREWKTAQNWARRLSAMAEEHGLHYLQLMGMHQLGVAMMGAGEAETGLPMMSNAVSACQAIGVETGLTGMYMRIGEASLLLGNIAAGLEAVDHALALTTQKGERLWEAELHRTKGNLLVQKSLGAKGKAASDGDAAESCFLAARELARVQGARKWELRATVALAHLWKGQKRRKQARELLIETRRPFTEGLDGADIHDLDALLAEL
jgi:DNA-binding winged helix-turn-helix (wHTH) protein/tetratricopeptide (TPR) repeat protein